MLHIYTQQNLFSLTLCGYCETCFVKIDITTKYASVLLFILFIIIIYAHIFTFIQRFKMEYVYFELL